MTPPFGHVYLIGVFFAVVPLNRVLGPVIQCPTWVKPTVKVFVCRRLLSVLVETPAPYVKSQPAGCTEQREKGKKGEIGKGGKVRIHNFGERERRGVVTLLTSCTYIAAGSILDLRVRLMRISKKRTLQLVSVFAIAAVLVIILSPIPGIAVNLESHEIIPVFVFPGVLLLVVMCVVPL